MRAMKKEGAAPDRPRPARARASTPPRVREVKVVAIGNSRGVRLPKAVLARYAIGDAVLLEEREEGLLLRSKADGRLSWEDTYRDMARAREDWSDLDATLGDGLDRDPW
jgi:antitoxin MazE